MQEEMRRVLEYASYRSRWWRSQCDRRETVSFDLQDGLRAYACKQAHLWMSLGKKFAAMWVKPLTEDVGGIATQDWPAEFRIVLTTGTPHQDPAIGGNGV